MRKDRSSASLLGGFLVGALAGATVMLLFAPQSGARTRRKIRRQAEDAADYIIEAGNDLVDNCHQLYRSTGGMLDDSARELSRKYKDLYEQSRHLLDETIAVIRR
ncbi:MAG: YtxH domain-containing protein [Bryobacterales bacterium]|nr:YtxH domain-containing protein [Bryobacterales bacterium]